MSDRARVVFPIELLKFSFVRMLPVWFGVAVLIFLMQRNVKRFLESTLPEGTVHHF